MEPSGRGDTASSGPRFLAPGLSGKKPADIQLREALVGLGEAGELDKRVQLLKQAFARKMRQTCSTSVRSSWPASRTIPSP